MTEGSGLRLAVDLGGTTTRAALLHEGAVQRRIQMPTCAKDGPDAVISRLIDLVEQLKPAARVPLGVACTGRVEAGRVTAVNQTTMPGWTAVPVAESLERALGIPVHVLNDARAATLGEWQARGALVDRNFMFVTVSTGIGSGLVLRGQLHDPPGGRDIGLGFTRGINGAALELSASGSALNGVAHSAGFSGAEALFDEAERNDPRAQALLHAPLSALADRLRDAHCLIGLDTICLGGSVGLRKYTQAFLSAAFGNSGTPDIQRAHHGPDAGLVGAALFAVHKAKYPGP